MTSSGACALPTRVIQFSKFTLHLPSSLLLHFFMPSSKAAEKKKHFHFLLAVLQKQRHHFKTWSEWKTVPTQAPDRVTENNNAVGNWREMNGCNIFWETQGITSKSSRGSLCNHAAVPQPLQNFPPSLNRPPPPPSCDGRAALNVRYSACAPHPSVCWTAVGREKKGPDAAVLLSCHMQY